MRPTGRVAAEGSGSVAVGGSNTGTISTVTAYGVGLESVASSILKTDMLHQRLSDFSGRAWLLPRIQAFISNNPAGYLIVQAGAGVGKTALTAWLQRTYSWPAHYSELSSSSSVALKNIGSQLMQQWGMVVDSSSELLPPIAGQPHWFEALLADVAQVRDHSRPGEPVVMLMDGLDEADPTPDGMPFGIPKRLPTGCFVVAASRPGVSLPVYGMAVDVIRLDAAGEENLRDMTAYLEARSRIPALAAKLKRANIPAEDFVNLLVSRSGGLWIYLRYLLDQLKNSDNVERIEIETLPVGLAAYYKANIQRWRRTETDWDAIFLPTVGALAAFREPVSLDQIVDIMGLESKRNAVRRFLENDLLAFLSITAMPVRSYRILHESFRDFVLGRLQSENDPALVGELMEAVRSSHLYIAQYYLALWGGIGEGLPLLEKDLHQIASYGRRSIVFHLCEAEDYETVRRLLQLDARTGAKGRPINLWYSLHDLANDLEGYLSDLQRAVELVDRVVLAELNTSGISPAIAEELRYLTMASAVKSQAATLSPVLLKVLVEEAIWTLGYALAHTKYISGVDRVKSVSVLLDLVPTDERSELLKAVLEEARSLEPPTTRASALLLLLPQFDGERRLQIFEAALYAARSAKEGSPRNVSILEVASHADREVARRLASEVLAGGIKDVFELILLAGLPLDEASDYAEAATDAVLLHPSNSYLLLLTGICPTGRVNEAVVATRALAADFHKGAILAGLGSRRDGVEGNALIREGIEITKKITDDYERTEELLDILYHLKAPTLREVVIAEALGGARRTRSSDQLSELLEVVSDERAELAREALEAANVGWDGEDFVDLAVAFLPHLSRAHQEELVQKVLSEVGARKLRPWWEVSTLTNLYATGWQAQSEEAARRLRPPIGAMALAKIGRHASEEKRRQLLREAKDLVQGLDYWDAEALLCIAEVSDQPVREELLGRALDILDGSDRVGPETVILIASMLPISMKGKFDQLVESLELDLWSHDQLARLLLEGPPGRGDYLLNRGDQSWRLRVLSAAAERPLPYRDWTRAQLMSLAEMVLTAENLVLLSAEEQLATRRPPLHPSERWLLLRSKLAGATLWQLRAELGGATDLIVELAGDASIEKIWLGMKDAERWWP